MNGATPGGLDFTLDEFQRYLIDAVAATVRLYRGTGRKRVLPAGPVESIRGMFDEPLPSAPMEMALLLKRVEEDVFGHSTMNVGPNYYGYVNSGGNHAGVIAELLSAAVDQNAGKWNLGPTATEIELRVIRWIAEFIGYPPQSGGVLVSGGSEANLTCLKVARDHLAPADIRWKGMRAGAQLTMYVSAEGHSCLDKSVDHLGIGREYLRKIPVLSDFTIDLEQLEKKVIEDRDAGFMPACVIGNAGTVNTGAVDPLHALADIASRQAIWFHIDAAYGGPAARTRFAGKMFAGIERADSVGTDAHKWLYAPFETGIAFVRKGELLRHSFSVVPDYLREENGTGRYDATEYHFQLSRNFKALRLWMAFKAYGSERIREAIEDNIRTMRHLADAIDASPDFERIAPAPLSIVCFRYLPDDRNLVTDNEYLSLLNRRILRDVEKEGKVFLSGTLIRGVQALRACSVNHRTKQRHVEYLLEVLRDAGRRAHASLRREKSGVVR